MLNEQSTSYNFLPTVQIKTYNVMIDRNFFFDKSDKNNLGIQDSIQIMFAGYNCFKEF